MGQSNVCHIQRSSHEQKLTVRFVTCSGLWRSIAAMQYTHSMTADRRRASRYELEATIGLRWKSDNGWREVMAAVCNLNTRAMMLYSPEPVATGVAVKVDGRLQRPGSTGTLQLSGSGYVLRCSERGPGTFAIVVQAKGAFKLTRVPPSALDTKSPPW